MTLLFFILLLFLLLCSALCSSSEAAYFSIPKAKIKVFSLDQNPNKKMVAALLHKAQSLLISIYLLNTVVNILFQNISSAFFDTFQGGFILKVGIPFLIILIFGEILPKYLGFTYNEYEVIHTARFYTLFHTLSKPLRALIYRIVQFFSRLFYFWLEKEKPLSEDELRYILETSKKENLINEGEEKLISGWLQLKQKSVVDIMIPRSKAPFYDIEQPFENLSHEKPLPAVEKTFDTLLGTIDPKDLFLYKPENKEQLRKILKKPSYIPESTSIKQLIQSMTPDTSLLFVIDEYSSISGILYTEDLINYALETSTGKTTLTHTSKNSIVVDGSTPIHECNAFFHTKLSSQYNLTSIGGYIIEKAGTIPASGYTLKDKNLLFRVITSDDTKIQKIYIEKRPRDCL